MSETWEADINSSVGSATIPEARKAVSKELCDKFSDLMSDEKLIAQESSLENLAPTGAAFKYTFCD